MKEKGQGEIPPLPLSEFFFSPLFVFIAYNGPLTYPTHIQAEKLVLVSMFCLFNQPSPISSKFSNFANTLLLYF